MAQEFISKIEMALFLETDQQILLIDIRSTETYRLSKIRGAMNINVPATAILLRRVTSETFNFTHLFSEEDKVVFTAYRRTRRIILYDSDTSELTQESSVVLPAVFNYLLSTGSRIYSLDLRNHGESPFCEDCDIYLMCEDVKRFTKERNLRRATFVCHSFSSTIAYLIALEKPDAVEKLVLVDQLPFGISKLKAPIFKSTCRTESWAFWIPP
ncbi:abhydrolase domain-containing protein 11 [Caerostris extrusa]|uniref:sn-1-specific diacylglycerol lipase ABHD11 n=1 Tax=Caerostris extrusa TaxID=172846 RepID=A0AAV4Y188_CAEEX|nr:abhydrolase domain-containing protein 11 [Caerostris extrusa]